MKKNVTTLPLCCLLFALLISKGHIQAQSPLRYEIDFVDARNHYITIRASLPAAGDQTELMMAVWTPGSYLVREFARHIDSIHIVDQDNNSLSFNKTRKNRWTVETKDVSEFEVNYRVYCNDLSVRTNFVDGAFAVLNGAPTFLTVPEYRTNQHIVKLKLPEPWTRSATSLNASTSAHEYTAATFDELVDSPIVAGNIHVYPFEVDGINHQLVNVGESGYWDGTKASADLKMIVKSHHELWKTIPYDRYLFINVICGRGGGLEHDNSTVMMTSRWSYRDNERYKNWLSLASHEFFHTWNVRRLRPRALINYDYENEVYTPSLWIAEGITSYYEDLLLARAGILEPDEWLKRISSNISSVQKRPGRLKQSLTESSYDTWIKFYRTSSNSSDTQISYYSKGAVVGFLLDAEIRSKTNGRKSLDDVMRIMFEKHANTGYLPGDFRAVVADVCGQPLNEFFKSYVDSTQELDYENALQYFGLKFKGRDSQSKQNQPPKESETSGHPTNQVESPNDQAETESVDEEPTDESRPGWLGFRLSDGRVSKIEPDSPAQQIGLNLRDEILAINGFRVRDNLDERLKQFAIGEELNLLISRRDQLMTKSVKLAEKPELLDWSLQQIIEPTDEQKSRFDEWLSK